MAEDKGKAEGGAEPKKSKTMLFVILASVILVIGVGAGAYLMGTKKAETTASADVATEQKDSKQEAEGESAIGPMVKIDNFVVNLLDKGEIHYLKASITLEVESPEVEEEVLTRMSQLRDLILLHAGNKGLEELADLQGKLQLRAELLAEINDVLLKGSVKKIYFTNFVIQ